MGVSISRMFRYLILIVHLFSEVDSITTTVDSAPTETTMGGRTLGVIKG